MTEQSDDNYTPPPQNHGAAWAIIILGLVSSAALASAGMGALGSVILVAAVGIAIFINAR